MELGAFSKALESIVRKINKARRSIAKGLAGIILIGNLSFPIAVTAGLIDQDNCEAPCGITAYEAEKEAKE